MILHWTQSLGTTTCTAIMSLLRDKENTKRTYIKSTEKFKNNWVVYLLTQAKYNVRNCNKYFKYILNISILHLQ